MDILAQEVTRIFGYGFLVGSLSTILAFIILDWVRLKKDSKK